MFTKLNRTLDYLKTNYHERRLDWATECDCVLSLEVSPSTYRRALAALRADDMIANGVLTGRRWIKQADIAEMAWELGDSIGVDEGRLLDALCARFLCDRWTARQSLEWAVASRVVTHCGNNGFGMIRAAATFQKVDA